MTFAAKDQDAAFTRLRAQGGFLVNAQQKGGQVVSLEILSTVGGPLRIVAPWTNQVFERPTAAGEVVKLPR